MGARTAEYYPHYTYDDYRLWEGDWELIYGIPYAMAPAPMIKHQIISNKIARFLDERLETCETCKALLPVDWKISDDTVVQPDNLVICHREREEAYLTQAPQLIFEILSKATALKDQRLKYELYEREGVRYYVIVDPQSEVAKVYQLNREGRYKKLCDAHHETVRFELDGCAFDFAFSNIWPKEGEV